MDIKERWELLMLNQYHKPALMIQYDIINAEGEGIWEGGNPARAIEAYRAAPAGCRVLVSGWETDGIETIPTGQPIDVTALIGAVRGGWVW
jgi:hypothetical protein